MGMLFVWTSCDDGCDVGATRCAGTVVQVCDGDAQWRDAQDCGAIVDLGDGGAWACCAADDAGPECWPGAACP
jgi:hypothetical protein